MQMRTLNPSGQCRLERADITQLHLPWLVLDDGNRFQAEHSVTLLNLSMQWGHTDI